MTQGERERDQRRRAMMEPSVHRDPRIINIDDLRPLFGPDGAPLLRTIAPVYEPAGRPAAFLSPSPSPRLCPSVIVSLSISLDFPCPCIAARCS